MTFDTDPAYNEQQDPSDPRFGEDEPCAETLRDPNAGTYGEDGTRISYPDDLASAEYERAIYEDHCCDWDDR